MDTPFLDFYHDTRNGDVLVWAGHSGRHIRLRFLASEPGNPDGVLEYDGPTFLGLVRRGVLERVDWDIITD